MQTGPGGGPKKDGASIFQRGAAPNLLQWVVVFWNQRTGF